ncbi:MAG: DUF559 domain-containing protein [Rhodospirillaceae bacterium]|nr:DUF559 domain-containing protein [Rhodospirillaceae bacterium]
MRKAGTLKARALRRNATDAEKALWMRLRNRQLGAKFHRQFAIGRYVVDFVAFEHKLVIEIDGGQHDLQRETDLVRTAFLNDGGLRVLRFWNNDVLGNIEGVLETIRVELSKQT